SQVTGLYPTDPWSHRFVTYRRVDCSGGQLSVLLQSDQSLYTRDQVVTASEGGRLVGRVAVAPTAEPTLTVPLRPGPDGVCTVRFRIARLENPSRVKPGSTDDRLVGARFLSFKFSR
ncbi:MAG: hypothetical protein M3Q31_13670, partial [Actinomycetota bacterium]|nr:hypothetical protein [Actinomycetota bacterium]